jgi:hypothetical protein
MSKNRQDPGSTSSTDASSTDSTQSTDFIAQQPKQPPATTDQLDALPGDDSVSNPVIINR